MSDGLGSRKTFQGNDDWDVNWWGLNHWDTRGLVDSLGFMYNELGSGGNESSTNDMLCCKNNDVNSLLSVA